MASSPGTPFAGSSRSAQITPASAAVRVARGSPGVTFFYTDGQSVNQLNIAAIEVQ